MGNSTRQIEARQERFRQNQRSDSLLKYAGLGAVGVAGAVALSAKTASADTIYSWSQMYSSSDTQSANNGPDNDFTVDGQTPSSYNYDLGGLSYVDGGVAITAYLANNDTRAGLGRLTGAFDRGTLGVSGKPDEWMAVEKNAYDEVAGKYFIGDLTNGQLTIAPENRVWSTFDLAGQTGGIEFNGVLNDSSQMPGCTSSGTLYIDTAVNLVPEPSTSVLLGVGIGATLIGKKVKGLVRKVFGRE